MKWDILPNNAFYPPWRVLNTKLILRLQRLMIDLEVGNSRSQFTPYGVEVLVLCSRREWHPKGLQRAEVTPVGHKGSGQCFVISAGVWPGIVLNELPKLDSEQPDANRTPSTWLESQHVRQLVSTWDWLASPGDGGLNTSRQCARCRSTGSQFTFGFVQAFANLAMETCSGMLG